MSLRTPLQEMQMLSGLDETGGELTEMDADQEWLYAELFLMASNYGDYYRKKDAKGAIAYAFKEYVRTLEGTTRADFKVIQSKLVKDLAKKWKTKSEDLDEALGPVDVDQLERYLDFIAGELKSAKSSLAKLKSNPQKYAPQRKNVIHHMKEIQKVARATMLRET